VALEHTLRTELRALREEMEDSSFNKSISSARLDSLQAEVKTFIDTKVSLLSTLIYGKMVKESMLIHGF